MGGDDKASYVSMKLMPVLETAVANSVNDELIFQVCDRGALLSRMVKRLESLMTFVKVKAGSDVWDDLFAMGSAPSTSSFEESVCKIVDRMYEERPLNSGSLLTLYTLLIDVLASKLKKGIAVNVERVFKSLHEDISRKGDIGIVYFKCF